MAVIRVQAIQNVKNDTDAADATWPVATAAGNLLVAIVTIKEPDSGDKTITPTDPLWTLAVASEKTGTGRQTTAIYYIENAASRSGIESFAITGVLADQRPAVCELREYSGMAASGALDQVASATGSGTTIASGTTLATTQADEVVIAGLGNVRNLDQSVPTDGHTSVNEGGIASTAGGTNAGIRQQTTEKLVTLTDVQSTSSTVTSTEWAAAIATFKAAVPVQIVEPDGGTVTTGWTKQDGGTTGFDVVLADDLDSTYVKSPDATGTPGNFAEVTLANPTDPAVSTGHKVRYRYSGSGVDDLVVELRQGVTVIASWTHVTPGATVTAAEQTLTATEADTITDYADLRIRVRGT